MDVVNRPVGELIPYEKNAKKHDRRQIANVAESIRQYGFVQPVVVDRDGVIVIGHCRVLAAKKLGMAEVPCVSVEDLTPEQVNALRIVDNKANESPWDLGLLAEELPDLDLSGFEFDLPKSVSFLASPGEVVEDEAPEVDEDSEPIAKSGDIWQLGRHRLMCGDCTIPENIDRLTNGEFMRMTVTSPPYGVGKDYEEKGISAWRETISGVINAIKGKTLIICWNIGDLFTTGSQFTEPTSAYSVQMMSEAGYGMLYNRIWKKPGANFAGNNPYYTVTTKPVQDYEYLFAFADIKAEKRLDSIKKYLFGEAKNACITNKIISENGGPKFMCDHWFKDNQWSMIDEVNYKLIQEYCKKNGIVAFERSYEDIKTEYLDNTIFSHSLDQNDFSEWGMYGIWEFNTVSKRLGGHAAAFPVELPTRYIKMHSYKGNKVLDPFGGTGTTMIACEQLDRTCYMMERDPKYCDVIIRRWENFTGGKAVKLN